MGLPTWAPAAIGISVGGAAHLFIARLTRSSGRVVAPISGLRDDFAEFTSRIEKNECETAVPLGVKLLAFVGLAHERKFLLASLSLCAEHAGDFAKCEELARMALALPSHPDVPLEDPLRIRRAFALATLDRAAEAERELEAVKSTDEHAAIAMRSRALILSKQGRHAEVLALLAGQSFGPPLGPRSIVLLERIREHATRAAGGGYRVAARAESAPVDVEDWVRRAAPHIS